MELDEKLTEIENRLSEKCKEIIHAENVLEILGIGGNILSRILAEMGIFPGLTMQRNCRN